MIVGITKGHAAANYIIWIRSLTPKIRELDNADGRGDFDDEKLLQGGADVECTELQFAYPQRPKTRVLRGVDAQVCPRLPPSL